MAYYAPDRWYEMDDVPFPEDPYGYIKEEDAVEIADGRRWMQAIITALYETGDIETLEDAVDTLSSRFRLKLPDRPLMIKSKRDESWMKLFKKS